MEYHLHSRVGLCLECHSHSRVGLGLEYHSHSRVGCKQPCRQKAGLSVQRVEMRLDRRVDMRQIRQISQKIGKLWSPVLLQLETIGRVKTA